VLRRKATLISLEVAPYFYALTRNSGSVSEDHILAYEDGQLTLAARNIYDALLDRGPLDSIALRKAAHMTGAKESEWNRALEDLQMDFKILPVGVAEAGSWRYAFIYDITARHFADLPERARRISESRARQRLVELYVASVGAARRRDVVHLFGWPAELVDRTSRHLEQNGVLAFTSHPKQSGDWMALPSLCR